MPRAPKKCGKGECEVRVRGRKFCDEHTVPWQGSARSTAHKSTEDRRLRRQVLDEEPECRDCGASSEVAGHIVPFAYGGPYIRSNLKGQCARCNNRQIAEDRKKFEAGGFRGFGPGPS